MMTTGYEAPPALQQISAPRRSGWVTTAAVVLLAIGTLSALFGLICLIIGLAFGPALTEMVMLEPGASGDVDPTAMSGMLTGVMVAFGIVSLAWAAGHVAAGVGVLGGHAWARITGMVLAIIGLLIVLLALLAVIASFGYAATMLQDPAMRDLYGGAASDEVIGAAIVTNILFMTPFILGYLIVLIVLIRNGSFFDRRPALAAVPAA
jgi:hypothetical protein